MHSHSEKDETRFRRAALGSWSGGCYKSVFSSTSAMIRLSCPAPECSVFFNTDRPTGRQPFFFLSSFQGMAG